MKSAKALSGEIPLNSDRLRGFVWIRKQTPRTNVPTQDIKPERNELNGKVPTRQQYKN